MAIEDFVDRKERHILEEILRELKDIKRILEPQVHVVVICESSTVKPSTQEGSTHGSDYRRTIWIVLSDRERE